MTARVLRPAITLTTVVGILLAALAVYALLSTGAAKADSTFSPTTTTKLCNDLGNGLSFATDPTISGTCSGGETAGLASGAHPDITTVLDIPKGQLNFSNVITLAPTTEVITPGASLATGEKIGGLQSATTLGTFNGPCNFFITVEFRFWNIALPNNPTNPRASTNLVRPRDQGKPNRFGRWSALGTEPIPFTDGVDTIVSTTTPPISADGGTVNTPIAGYPDFLLDAFDPDFVPGVSDGPLKPLVPLAVYGGLTQVVGDWIPLYLVQFGTGGPTGTASDLTGLTASPLQKITPAMGQPQVAVLSDPTAPAAPSDITDFCSHLGTKSMLLGTTGSGDRVTNPTAGATGVQQFFLQYFASLRDLDQDSYENNLDTCPKNVNQGDPRVTPAPANDTDGDGIDNACDTDNTNVGVSDQDTDAYKNRLDNCPQVANGNPVIPSTGPTFTPNPGFQLESELANTGPAADNGPNTDGMGDLCDAGSAVTVNQNNTGPGGVPGAGIGGGAPALSITPSNTTGNGRYMTATNLVAKCIGGTDADGDGYCAGLADSFDSGPAAAARHLAWDLFPVSTTTAGVTWPSSYPFLQMDSDRDLFPDTQETWMSQCDSAIVGQVRTPCGPFPAASPFVTGVDAAHSCAQTLGTANDEGPWDNWGFDFDDTGLITGTDKGPYANAIKPGVVTTVDGGGTTGHQGFITGVGLGSGFYTVPVYRYDLNNDGVVNGTDLGKFAISIGKTCGNQNNGLGTPFPTMVPAIPAFSQQ